MKKLICAKDMEEFISEGKTKFYVASDMIITPSAKDVAKLNGIEFTTEAPVCEVQATATSFAEGVIIISLAT